MSILLFISILFPTNIKSFKSWASVESDPKQSLSEYPKQTLNGSVSFGIHRYLSANGRRKINRVCFVFFLFHEASSSPDRVGPNLRSSLYCSAGERWFWSSKNQTPKEPGPPQTPHLATLRRKGEMAAMRSPLRAPWQKRSWGRYGLLISFLMRFWPEFRFCTAVLSCGICLITLCNPPFAFSDWYCNLICHD